MGILLHILILETRLVILSPVSYIHSFHSIATLQ